MSENPPQCTNKSPGKESSLVTASHKVGYDYPTHWQHRMSGEVSKPSPPAKGYQDLKLSQMDYVQLYSVAKSTATQSRNDSTIVNLPV